MLNGEHEGMNIKFVQLRQFQNRIGTILTSLNSHGRKSKFKPNILVSSIHFFITIANILTASKTQLA